jgi:signal transduction histidine kinase
MVLLEIDLIRFAIEALFRSPQKRPQSMPRRLLDSLYDKFLSRFGLLMLAVALLVNVGALLMIDREVVKLDLARAMTMHSREVMAEILKIQSLLYEAESAQRSYLYTANKDYLQPWNENEVPIATGLAKLREHVADNPPQQRLVDLLAKIAGEKILLMNKTIALQQMGQADAARALVMTNQGKKLIEEFEAAATDFTRTEETLLAERRQKWTDLQVGIRWGFAAIFLINAMLILLSSVTIMRDMAGKRAELVQLDERATVLTSEVAQRAEELRALTAHLLRVQEEERRMVARELHDELGGTLSAVKLDILMGRDAAAKRNDEKSVARLQRAISAIDSGIQFIRRLIENLRPTLLDNLGFEAALQSMAESFSERTGIACTISLPDGELKLTSAQSTALYRVCQEALTNVMKYAKAKKVSISLTTDGSQWALILADDGVGLAATRQHRAMSHGLLGMRERIVGLGGNFDIRGDAGRGTTLTASFPIEGPELPKPADAEIVANAQV